MKTLQSTVAFQSPQGVVAANGYLVMTLAQDCTIIAGGGWVYSQAPVVIKLDVNGKIPGATQIWANDELTPSCFYNVDLQDSNRSRLDNLGQWVISGASPIDVSQIIPSNTTPSFSGPVLLNPVGNQTITSGNLTLAAGNLSVVGNGTFTGTLGVTGAVTAGSLSGPFVGPSPWIDVTAPPNGAKCDGVTDDTTAFQAGITAAIAAKTALMVPMGKQCIIAASGTKALNADSSTDLTIFSLYSGSTITGNTRPNITFTGTPSVAAISAQGSNRFTLRGITLSYTSASFNSRLLDLTNTAFGWKVENSYLTGAGGGAVNASALIAAGGTSATGGKVIGSSFGDAVKCVDLGGIANAVVHNNDFGSATFPCSTVELTGLAQGASVIGNNFEMLGNAGTQTAIDASTFGCLGCFIGGNWFGDMTAGYTGPLIKASGGMAFVGNRFQGAASGTLMTVNGTQQSLTFTGNYANGWTNLFSCDGPISEVSISGNTWGTDTNFNVGAGPCFTAAATTGLAIDQNHNPVTLQVRAPGQGTAALPALTFTTANNTGFWTNNNNDVTLTNAGVSDIDWIPGIARQKSTEVFAWTSGAATGVAGDTNQSRAAAGVIQAGTGETANSNGSYKAAALISGGAAATFTGSTGACSTQSTQTGGSFAGRLTCTAVTAASTLVIIPGTTAPNGWICYAQDQTTRANLLQQTANTQTNCTLTATSVTQNDVIVFTAIAF